MSRLRESTETFHADAMAETEPPPPGSLELAPRLGVGIHLLRDDHSLDLARDAGFKFVRMDMLWANVERGGRYRFFAYDALLRALDARGMGVLWILDYGHPDHGGSTPRTPQDIAAFGRFAEAAAAHFKGRNVRYEIWNEPNTDRFWTPAPNSSEYAALLREAVAAIRRADPAREGFEWRYIENRSRVFDPSRGSGSRLRFDGDWHSPLSQGGTGNHRARDRKSARLGCARAWTAHRDLGYGMGILVGG